MNKNKRNKIKIEWFHSLFYKRRTNKEDKPYLSIYHINKDWKHNNICHIPVTDA